MASVIFHALKCALILTYLYLQSNLNMHVLNATCLFAVKIHGK